MSNGARDRLNNIKQHYDLQLKYYDYVSGPEHNQVWTGVWILAGTAEIGRAIANSRSRAKEESAHLAVLWLINSGHQG